MGGFILATVTTTGWFFPVYGLSIFSMLHAFRFQSPECMFEVLPRLSERKRKKTRKVVDMGKSMICELAKAALITVLFHTIGIDALSL